MFFACQFTRVRGTAGSSVALPVRATHIRSVLQRKSPCMRSLIGWPKDFAVRAADISTGSGPGRCSKMECEFIFYSSVSTKLSTAVGSPVSILRAAS